MADESFAGVGTRQYVALKLLEAIGQGQDKAGTHSPSGTAYWKEGADEDWILDTYVECLRATRGDRKDQGSGPSLRSL